MVDKIKDSKGDTHYVGKKRLVDLETGEQFDAQTIVKTVGDRDFKKIFVSAILDKVDTFTNAKLKFLFWMLENADKQNRIFGTYDQLSKRSKVSKPTIARLIPTLRDSDIIRVISPSVYMLNPDIVAGVSSNSRSSLLVKYCELDETEVNQE